MKKEYDFSKGVRGKFYNPEAEFNSPIYLEPEIAEFVQKLSQKKKVDRSQIVNQLLRKDMEIKEIWMVYLLAAVQRCLRNVQFRSC